MLKRPIVTILTIAALIPSLVRGEEGINGVPDELFGEKGSVEIVSARNCYGKKSTSKQGYVGMGNCWRACEALLPEGTKWPDIVQRYGQGTGQVEDLWTPALDLLEEREMDNPSGKAGKHFSELISFLHLCHALSTMSSHSKYSDAKITYHGRNMYGKKSVVNPELVCKTMGLDTQDYPKCNQLIKLYDTFTFAKKAKQTVDVIRQDEHVFKEQDKLHEKRMNDETVGTEDVLSVQKEGLEKQKDITGENLVISAAQLASLSAIVNSMPTLKTLLSDECEPVMRSKENVYDDLFESRKKQFKRPTMGWKHESLEAGPLCTQAYKTFHNLILNTDVRDVGKSLIIQSGVELVADFAKRAIIKDRIKGLEGAIKSIEGFEPESLTEEEMESIYLRECIVNPTLPKCKNKPRKKVDGVRNSYSFGGNNKPTLVGGVVSDEKNGGNDGGSPDVDRNDAPKALGVPLPDASSLGNNDFTAPPPSGGTYAGKGTGNPGGGGGKASSVSSPGGGTGGGDGGDGTSADSPSSTKVAYDGSGSGWKGGYTGGGNSSRTREKNGNSNPFSQLFKKKGGTGDGSEVMNFRLPASKKGKSGSIFQRISTRYQDVSKKKQLLEYTVEKED